MKFKVNFKEITLFKYQAYLRVLSYFYLIEAQTELKNYMKEFEVFKYYLELY